MIKKNQNRIIINLVLQLSIPLFMIHSMGNLEDARIWTFVLGGLFIIFGILNYFSAKYLGPKQTGLFFSV
jgi:hypothetical protein